MHAVLMETKTYYRTDLAAIVRTNKGAECEYLRGSCARSAN